jgi:hypothetical protein
MELDKTHITNHVTSDQDRKLYFYMTLDIAASLLTGFISLFFNIMPGQDYFML